MTFRQTFFTIINFLNLAFGLSMTCIHISQGSLEGKALFFLLPIFIGAFGLVNTCLEGENGK